MKKHNYLILSYLIFFSYLCNSLKAQNVGINGNGNTAHPSALLDIDAVATPSLGMLIPRIALQAINVAAPVTSPANSLLVFNTASVITTPSLAVTPGYYYWDLPNNTWVRFAYNSPGSLGNAWTTLGNLGTNASTHFLGTTDAQDLVFKTNNIERMRILNSGNIGVGTTAPTASLHIVATATNTGLQLQDGTQGANKILVSDAVGKASWENINTVITNSGSGGSFGSNGNYPVVKLHQGNTGPNHYALLSDGSVIAWGNEYYGQIGEGPDNTDKMLPTYVNLPGPCKEVVMDDQCAFFVLQNGDVYSVGYNGYGNLGVGDATQRNNPAKVLNVSNIIKVVSTRNDETFNPPITACALSASGQLWCWGYNGYGQVGNGVTGGSVLSPALIYPSGVIDVDGGGSTGGSFCVIKNDSTIACWGYNAQGQLGIGSTVNSNTPQAVPLLTKVKHLQGIGGNGASLRRCAIRSNGDLYCWGTNNVGQVGNGTLVNQVSPVLITSNIKQIALSETATYALTNSGNLFSWGGNIFGELGIGSNITQNSPQLISSISSVDTVICPHDNYSSAWAIKNMGNIVYGWGNNANGAIGDGTTTNRNLPTLINLSNVKFMTTSQFLGTSSYPIVLLKDSGVKCWGSGQYGLNANGTTINQYFPQLIKR